MTNGLPDLLVRIHDDTAVLIVAIRDYTTGESKQAAQLFTGNRAASTDHTHLASEKISAVEQGAEALLKRARWIGPHTASWAETMLKKRGIQGVRVLVGLLSLAGKYSGGREIQDSHL